MDSAVDIEFEKNSIEHLAKSEKAEKLGDRTLEQALDSERHLINDNSVLEIEETKENQQERALSVSVDQRQDKIFDPQEFQNSNKNSVDRQKTYIKPDEYHNIGYEKHKVKI